MNDLVLVVLIGIAALAVVVLLITALFALAHLLWLIGRDLWNKLSGNLPALPVETEVSAAPQLSPSRTGLDMNCIMDGLTDRSVGMVDYTEATMKMPPPPADLGPQITGLSDRGMQ